jgi:hypothetical protein
MNKNLRSIKDIRKNEFGWLIDHFKKNKIGTHISELGLTPEAFTDEFKFDIDVENFATSESNADNTEVDYYRYETTVPGHQAQRPFCKTLMRQSDSDLLFSYSEIVSMNNASGKADRKGGGGYSVFKYRGGIHCKHKWVKYRFDKEKGELVKGRTQPPRGAVGHA